MARLPASEFLAQSSAASSNAILLFPPLLFPLCCCLCTWSDQAHVRKDSIILWTRSKGWHWALEPHTTSQVSHSMLRKSFSLRSRWGWELPPTACHCSSSWCECIGRGRALCCWLMNNERMMCASSSRQAGNPRALLRCTGNIWLSSTVPTTSFKAVLPRECCQWGVGGRNGCRGCRHLGGMWHCLPPRRLPKAFR